MNLRLLSVIVAAPLSFAACAEERPTIGIGPGSQATAIVAKEIADRHNQGSQAAPLLPSAHPKTFCELARDLGYPSRGYNPATGGCASNMTDVTSNAGRNGLANNLAFYSMGEFDNPAKLMRVSLILNVNNIDERAQAHAELARVAGVVATRILGVEPQNLKNTIRQGSSGEWALSEWTTEVKYSIWPTGHGHDISVHFRPKHGD